MPTAPVARPQPAWADRRTMTAFGTVWPATKFTFDANGGTQVSAGNNVRYTGVVGLSDCGVQHARSRAAVRQSATADLSATECDKGVTTPRDRPRCARPLHALMTCS